MSDIRRIRIHGRGGQGAKTAGRIVGTAAFVEGYQAQDSPVYGAERRGAPMTAHARIAQGAILERGQIARPSLVLVADESLLADPAARVSAGATDETAVFVNTSLPAEELRVRAGMAGRMTTLDLTGLTIEQFGKPSSLSAPIGAVACRLLGLKPESLRAAVADELAGLGLSATVIARNQTLAALCYDRVPVVPVEAAAAEPAVRAALRTPVYEPPTVGTARISAGANSPLHRTGGWRTFRPMLVPDQCIGCWLCFVYCPDAVITMKGDDRPLIHYEHCKGCLICVEECPTGALIAEREREGAVAWRAR
jgi:pyruvate ferredoxin oxidoreductase gamma subunit